MLIWTLSPEPSRTGGRPGCLDSGLFKIGVQPGVAFNRSSLQEENSPEVMGALSKTRRCQALCSLLQAQGVTAGVQGRPALRSLWSVEWTRVFSGEKHLNPRIISWGAPQGAGETQANIPIHDASSGSWGPPSPSGIPAAESTRLGARSQGFPHTLSTQQRVTREAPPARFRSSWTSL